MSTWEGAEEAAVNGLCAAYFGNQRIVNAADKRAARACVGHYHSHVALNPPEELLDAIAREWAGCKYADLPSDLQARADQANTAVLQKLAAGG